MIRAPAVFFIVRVIQRRSINIAILAEAGAAYLCYLKRKEEQRALLLCNLLTNPFLNLVLSETIRNRRPLPLPTVLLFEALIVLAEGCLLRLLFGKERRFFALSLACSAASYGLGLLLSALLL